MMRQPTRRTLLSAALIGALVAAGCGSGDPGTTDASSSTLPAAEGRATYPMTIETPYGNSELRERPTRIAAVVPTGSDAELLLALGVRPVIASSMIRDAAAYLGPVGGATLPTFSFSMGQSLPVEEIAAARPDLIVAVGWNDGLGRASLGDYYSKLTAIAPVVTSANPHSKVIVPWQESISRIAEVLDLGDRAREVTERVEKGFSDLRGKYPTLSGRTASWVVWYGASNGLQYFSQPGSAAEKFLTELGFAHNPKSSVFAQSSAVSDELLSNIDADAIIVGTGASADSAALTDKPIFRQLSAAAAGRVAVIPPANAANGDIAWAITTGGPIAWPWAAERVAPLVADKL